MGIVIYTEDEPAVSDVILPILEKCVADFGHTVMHFSRGSDAREKIIELAGSIPLLVTDIDLNDNIGGLQLAREVAKCGVRGVFVLPSSAESNDTRNYMERLAKNYGLTIKLLNKPVEPVLFMSMLNDLLEE